MTRRPRLDHELERYLVTGETVIVAVQLHWFHIGREVLLAVAATVLAFWVDVSVPTGSGGKYVHDLSLILWWAALLWLGWSVLNWRHEWFVATDKRFLLFYGFLRRKVAMMPLQKVTDMTYDRSLLGRVVGYGKFVLESAGQDQALSAIDHVPDADTHYRAICTQLFGPTPPPPSGGPPPRSAGYDGGTDGGGGGRGSGGRGGGDRGGGGGPAPDAGGPGGVGGSREPASAGPARAQGEGHTPESWYRSSNLRGPSHLGDTGEIPVVRRPARDEEDVPLYPPSSWSDRG